MLTNTTATFIRDTLPCRRRPITRSVSLIAHLAVVVLMCAASDPACAQAIAYRGAGTNAVASSGNVTPGLPAGWQANDLHLLIVEQKDSVASTVPAGWTPVTGSPINSGASNRAAVWWRVAVAGDTAPTVTHTAGSVIIARIIGFSGVNTTTPLDVNNSFTASACDYTTEAASITTVTANTMLVFAGLIGTEFTTYSTPSGSSPWTTAFLSSTQLGSEASIGAFYGLRGAAGAMAALVATGTSTQCGISFGAQIALRPANVTPTYNQTVYRLFNNTDSTDVGSPLAARNTAATLGSSNVPFRLRMLVGVTNIQLSQGGETFKLQFAPRSGTCDTAFSGETYADVTSSTAIAFNNNATPADGANMTTNANDPVDPGITSQFETYQESNNFGVVQDVAANENGKWDFSLIDNGAPGSTAYCFRAVLSSGLPLHNYTVVPEITTAPRGTVFYFHDASTPDTGTLPAGTTISATTPDVTSATASTNRDMNQTPGTLQTSAALTTLAQTTLQRNWFRRFVSRPLAAQTLPTGLWKVQGGASESSTSSNVLPWGTVLKVWRPSTGSTVATLLDNPTLGTVEPGTTETNIASLTSSINGVSVLDGDVLVAELWAQGSQANATARTNTIFYDGTTEGSTSSNSAYLQAPGVVSFYRTISQYDYRVFNNADSTDVGTALAAQNTPATLASTGAAFRSRMLLHVTDVNLGASGQSFKLQFAGKGSGTCAAPSGGTPAAYTDVTAATIIAYNDNPTPANGAALTANANDPTHSPDAVVNQTYSESNNFTNSAAINAGQDGQWDFSLKDNGAAASTTYCLRAAQSTGTALDVYSNYPEITTAAANAAAVTSFNGFETSTAAAAITGRTLTKLTGTAFSLDVVAINAGAQSNSFGNNVKVELLANTGTAGSGYGADNCPSSNSVVQSIASTAISGGRSTVNFSAVANAYRDVRLRVSYPTSSPTVTTCSTDSFSIRPTAFSGVTSSMTNTGTSGTPNAKAGAAFTLTAVAGAGYDGAPSINSALVSAHAGAVQVGAIAGSFGAANSATGTATGSSFTYSEVGNFTLGVDAVYDSSFTSVDPPGTDCTNDFSNALVGGKVGCSFGNTSAAGPFGRFTPDHFDVTMNTPSFGTACGSFTYVGQSFSYTTAPVLTVTARNAAALGNATTRNYIGPNDGSSWWKITASSLTGKAYSQLPASPALTASATSPDPLIATGGDGTGTLTFNSGAGFSFTRGSPVAAFDAEIALAINVIDADAVAYAGNPAHIGTASTGNGIAFNSGKNMRFGELALGSAAGTTSQILYLPVHANYWNGTGWVTNTADACTGAALAQASIVLGNQVKKPGTGGTFATSIIASPSLTSTWSQGTGQIALAAPNAPGTAQVALNLGSAVNDASCTGWSVTSTGAALPWLRGPWCGSSYTNDPSTLAIFGLASSSQPFVFMRENY